MQWRAMRRHWLAASAAGRAAFIGSRSVNTNSRTRAARTDRSMTVGCGRAETALNTNLAFGSSDAAHTVTVDSTAWAPHIPTRQNKETNGIVRFILTSLSR
jgi:hypothetical protein